MAVLSQIRRSQQGEASGLFGAEPVTVPSGKRSRPLPLRFLRCLLFRTLQSFTTKSTKDTKEGKGRRLDGRGEDLFGEEPVTVPSGRRKAGTQPAPARESSERNR